MSKGRIRIGTLGWVPSSDTSVGKKKQSRSAEYQSVNDFVGLLQHVAGNIPKSRRPDLILCAGYPVSGIPNEERLSEALDGSSVLFEKGKGGGPWILGGQIKGRTKIVTLRKKQLLYRSDESTRALLHSIVAGEGTFRFSDFDMPFTLLICGENNALRYSGGSSVFYGGASKPLPEMFNKPWAVLNPAHMPYYPPIRAKGFAKVGVIESKGKKYTPTMKQAVDIMEPYADGTMAPQAFIHTNNLSGSRWKETGKHSSMVFFEAKPGSAKTIKSLSEKGRWKFDLYELP